MRCFRLTPAIWLALGQLAAFWPVWRWYGLRLADRSDQPWGILALATVAVYAAAPGRPKQAPENARPSLRLPALLLLVYLVTWPWAPRLLQAGLAFLSVGRAAQTFWLGRRMHPAAWGLILLSLPLLPSLEFYLGYPLRVLTGALAGGLLRLSGFMVTLEGTTLSWNGRLVSIDAPCGGLKMLWAGLYLAMTLACFMELPRLRSVWLSGLALAAVIAGNALRAAALFFAEAGLIHLPPWGHAGVGIVIFAALAGGLGWLAPRQRRSAAPCRP